MTTEPRSRRRRIAVVTVALGLVVVVAGVAMISTDVLGTGRLFDRAVAKVDRFLAGPVPDRSAPVTVLVQDPDESDDPGDTLDATPSETAGPNASGPGGPTITPVPAPTASPTPTPARVPVDVTSRPTPRRSSPTSSRTPGVHRRGSR